MEGVGDLDEYYIKFETKLNLQFTRYIREFWPLFDHSSPILTAEDKQALASRTQICVLGLGLDGLGLGLEGPGLGLVVGLWYLALTTTLLEVRTN